MQGRNGSEAVGGTAGYSIYAQDNWNDDGPNGQSSAGGISNLMDNSGAATTVDVSWATGGTTNSWTVDSDLSTPDRRLNNGFLNRDAIVNVSDLPSEYTDNGYSLLVYYNNNEGPGTSDVTITGSIDDMLAHQIITGPTASSRFDENGYLFEDGSLLGPTNVTLFEGLDDPNFAINFTTASGSLNNGITAFQIVANQAVPGPSSWIIMLMVMSAAFFYHFARRRRSVRT